MSQHSRSRAPTLELEMNLREVSQSPMMEEGPTSAFTFKKLLRHYDKAKPLIPYILCVKDLILYVYVPQVESNMRCSA